MSIEATDIKNMVEHWLSTPPNSYFGQSYGADVRSMLLKELSADNADSLLKKLRADIPLLNQLNENQLSVSTLTADFDKLYVYLNIGGINIELGEAETETLNQDFYNVRAQ